MKFKTLSVISFCLISTMLYAQTKKIAFESHSGSPENFAIVLSNEFFSSDESDFGLPSSQTIYELKKVVFVSDSVAVLIKKEYKKPWGANDSAAKFIKERADTIRNNPLFAKRHSLDSIRAVMKNWDFINADKLNEVRFKGYDNNKPAPLKPVTDKPVTNKQDIIFVSTINNKPGNNQPFDMQLMLMAGSILLLSLVGGWLSWKFYKPRIQKQLV